MGRVGRAMGVVPEFFRNGTRHHFRNGCYGIGGTRPGGKPQRRPSEQGVQHGSADVTVPRPMASRNASSTAQALSGWGLASSSEISAQLSGTAAESGEVSVPSFFQGQKFQPMPWRSYSLVAA